MSVPTAAQPLPPAPPTSAGPAPPLGWWRGDEVCVELFANGDFELSLSQSEPKVMVIGAATILATDAGHELQLATARIWKGRYMGPCRKIHETGDWIESQEVLGVRFQPGVTSTLTLRPKGQAQVELCGQRCATLTQATPQLGARWRREGLEIPDRPEVPWSAGDLLELRLHEGNQAHLWAGSADRTSATGSRPESTTGPEFARVYGTSAVRFVSADRFEVIFTAERFDDVPQGTTPVVLGLSFGAGKAHPLQVRRLAGERIEVCGAAERCATLAREFDPYHYDID